MKETYFPQERALLCDYFTIARPPELADLDVRVSAASVDSGDAGESAWPDQPSGDPILIEPDCNGDYSDLALPNAVARIVLSHIQRRLPQWGYVKADGAVVVNRRYRKSPARQVSFFPQHLFTMNWADSAPGFSWPEAYYATYVPGFDRHVVTASNDGPDAQGYADYTIGWFSGTADIRSSAKQIITGWWAQARDEYDKSPWEYTWEPGLISDAEALEWRDEVWPEAADGDDDEDERSSAAAP